MDIESALNEMKQLHNEVAAGILLIGNTHKDSIPKAIRLGELLVWCKSQYGDHGKWMAFMKDNLPFSQQTASKYVRVYELNKEGKLPDVDNVSDLYFLLGIKDEETQESLIAESKASGQTVRAVHAGRVASRVVNVANGEQTPADVPKPPPADDPVITEDMWKCWKDKKLRARILSSLESMGADPHPILHNDRADDLGILRRMVDEELRREINRLKREQRKANVD